MDFAIENRGKISGMFLRQKIRAKALVQKSKCFEI
jgi:hypothetical protein